MKNAKRIMTTRLFFHGMCIFQIQKPNWIIVPLKAIVDGETIIGPDLSSEEWTKLKLRHRKGLPVKMSCCGAPGHLRISKRGTQHFYHAVDTGCHYAEESREHLEIKYQIYKICKSEQWETYIEFPAPDRTWISDVYATRDGRKIVFEVQISTISPDDLEDRDKKYRNEGIESYWLLDTFLERSKDFESWYDSHLFEEDDRHEESIPYIDHSLFETGPENHIFIPKGIRSVGLDARDQTLFTTNNPEISLAVWVREVLKGNYQKYLEETAAAYHRKRRLLIMAAPALFQFRDFYEKIIRHKTFREKVGHYYHIFKTGTTLMSDKALEKKFHDLYSEIDWLDNEYRSYVSESSGLFMWKKIPEYDTPRPYFRLESESNVKKLQECIKTFTWWEESFDSALGNLEREFAPQLKRYDKRE
jgi:competence CoiA-like predicted nuclease